MSYVIIVLIIIILIFIGYIINQSMFRSNCVSQNNKELQNSLKKLNTSRIRSLEDDSFRLRDYYIMSSFNSCCGGNFVNDCVDTKPLRLLVENGVRFLDFEIYSIDNVPVIAASDTDEYSYKSTINNVSFDRVIRTIRDLNGLSIDPLFLHFRIHTNNIATINEMYRIIEEHISSRLYRSSNVQNTENFGNTPMSELRGRIVIMCEKSNIILNSKLNMITNVYTGTNIYQLLRFFDVQNTPNEDQLIELNRLNTTIVIPDKNEFARNFNSDYIFETGCQFICMNYQYVNTNLINYVKRFNENRGSFIVKPEKLRYIEQPIDKPEKQKPEVGLSNVQTTEIPGGIIQIG